MWVARLFVGRRAKPASAMGAGSGARSLCCNHRLGFVTLRTSIFQKVLVAWANRDDLECPKKRLIDRKITFSPFRKAGGTPNLNSAEVPSHGEIPVPLRPSESRQINLSKVLCYTCNP